MFFLSSPFGHFSRFFTSQGKIRKKHPYTYQFEDVQRKILGLMVILLKIFTQLPI